jgi:hypothetical protein
MENVTSRCKLMLATIVPSVIQLSTLTRGLTDRVRMLLYESSADKRAIGEQFWHNMEHCVYLYKQNKINC